MQMQILAQRGLVINFMRLMPWKTWCRSTARLELQTITANADLRAHWCRRRIWQTKLLMMLAQESTLNYSNRSFTCRESSRSEVLCYCSVMNVVTAAGVQACPSDCGAVGTHLPARPVLCARNPHEWELNEHDVLAQPSPCSVSPFNG